MADYTICDDWGEGSGLELHEKNCNEDQIGKKITFIKLITTVPYLYFILSIKTCSETQSVVNINTKHYFETLYPLRSMALVFIISQ